MEKNTKLLDQLAPSEPLLPNYHPNGNNTSTYANYSVLSNTHRLAVRLMNNKPLWVASLNARSVFKRANAQRQKEFISYLLSLLLRLDILCIQELTVYHRQTTSTLSQIQSCKYLFHKATGYTFDKQCGIFYLNRNLSSANLIY